VRKDGRGEYQCLVSFACMLVRVSPVVLIFYSVFSLKHGFPPELAFHVLLRPAQFLLSSLAYLCSVSFTSYRALLPAQYLFTCTSVSFGVSSPTHGAFSSLPWNFLYLLVSVCPLPYLSMKQFPSFHFRPPTMYLTRAASLSYT
jgi:hypothetical protein